MGDEIDVMRQMSAALETLDGPVRARALAWLNARFGSEASTPPASRSEPLGADVGRFGSFAELFDAAHPKLDKEKALVAAYWLQVAEGEEAFNAQALNSELKHLGHGIGNITDALSALISERPALVLQVRKSGTSRQARKTYKMSEAGKRRVLDAIAGPEGGRE